MPSADRSVGRNVHIYDASNPDTVLGGLYVNNGVTNASFHLMIEIIFFFSSDYSLRDEDGNTILRNNYPLQPNKYYIVTQGSITVTDETPVFRLISTSSSTRVGGFRDAVRNRDRRCLITGIEAEDERGDWSGFEAAHVFPLAYEGYWQEHDFSRWITIPSVRGGSINSVQNGILLRSDIHQLFDMYNLSINPDDNYKIIVFNKDRMQVSGRQLDQQFLENPERTIDQLLRWHFRQAVLANMKGGGMPVFEFDFPPGSDILGDIRDGPMAAQRMEFELFNRLAVE